MTNYNLGCYACQLGDMFNAKKFVRYTIKLDSKYKLMALDDEDLNPLWDMKNQILAKPKRPSNYSNQKRKHLVHQTPAGLVAMPSRSNKPDVAI